MRSIRWALLLAVAAALALASCGSPATDSAPVAAQAVPRDPGPGFRSRTLLEEHFLKHGSEFGARSAAEYLRLARALRDRPAGGPVLERVRRDGVITRFDRGSGAFIAFEADGVIRTFFRPRDGERYFERQALRDGRRR